MTNITRIGTSRELPETLRSRKGQLPHAVLPTPPNDVEKYLYIRRHVYWLIVPSIFSMVGLVISQTRFATQAWYLYVYLPFVFILVAYWLISLLVNVGTRDFKRKEHEDTVRRYVESVEFMQQRVDVILPICNEPLDVLQNAWYHISRLKWNPELITFWVLDDGASDVAKAMAEKFASQGYDFQYVRRPDVSTDSLRPHMRRGHLQKSGNMLYGHELIHELRGGECGDNDASIVFDADFCPRPEMLIEQMSYMVADQTLGIVQTPQYFRVLGRKYGMFWLERGAGAVQELFYRMVQVSRQQRDAAICVGTNALYRRRALNDNIQKVYASDGTLLVNAPYGGPTQIGHSEDVHTGFDLRKNGWGILYIPVIYATGICPSVRSAFMAQQYRWCMGSMSLLTSKKFWDQAKTMRLRGLFGYFSGFAYYITTALMVIIGPLVPITLLIFLPGLIELQNYLLIVPSVIYTLVIFPLWHKHTYGLAAFATRMLYGWAHLFAIADVLRGRAKAWSPTGASAKHKKSTKMVLKRQMKIGLGVWGHGTAAVWTVLAVWNIAFPQGTASWWDFVPMAVLGAINWAIVTQASMAGTPKKIAAAAERESAKPVEIDTQVVKLPKRWSVGA